LSFAQNRLGQFVAARENPTYFRKGAHNLFPTWVIFKSERDIIKNHIGSVGLRTQALYN
jgi:hypothetical protein